MIFMGYITALDYYRSAKGSRLVVSNTLLKACPKVGDGVDTRVAEETISSGLVARLPMHVMIAGHGDRSVVSGVKCIEWSRKFPLGSFLKLEKGVYISSPEACFVQMAASLDLVGLILLGYELCGNYVLKSDAPISSVSIASDHGEDDVCVEATGAQTPCSNTKLAISKSDDALGFYSRKAPLVTFRRLEFYVSQCEGVRGIKKARRALRYVCPNSNSPMESIISMLLSLPLSMGGFGLPFPQLNACICIPGKVAHSRTGSRRYSDIYWPKAKLVLEYDSKVKHSGERARTSDSIRRNEIEYTGRRVRSMVSAQFFSYPALESQVLTLMRDMKIRHRAAEKRYFLRRFELHRRLVSEARGLGYKTYSD